MNKNNIGVVVDESGRRMSFDLDVDHQRSIMCTPSYKNILILGAQRQLVFLIVV